MADLEDTKGMDTLMSKEMQQSSNSSPDRFENEKEFPLHKTAHKNKTMGQTVEKDIVNTIPDMVSPHSLYPLKFPQGHTSDVKTKKTARLQKSILIKRNGKVSSVERIKKKSKRGLLRPGTSTPRSTCRCPTGCPWPASL